jgi:hypothetical protein
MHAEKIERAVPEHGYAIARIDTGAGSLEPV